MFAPHNLELMLFRQRFHKSMYNVYFTRFGVNTNIKLKVACGVNFIDSVLPQS